MLLLLLLLMLLLLLLLLLLLPVDPPLPVDPNLDSCTIGWVSCTFGEVARSKPATEKNRRIIASNSLQCLQPLWGCSVESEKAVEGAVAGAWSVASRKLVQPPLNAEKTGCVE